MAEFSKVSPRFANHEIDVGENRIHENQANQKKEIRKIGKASAKLGNETRKKIAVSEVQLRAQVHSQVQLGNEGDDASQLHFGAIERSLLAGLARCVRCFFWRGFFRFRRNRRGHIDELADGDEFVAFGQKRIERGRHGVHGCRMNVVRENDVAGAHIFQDAAFDARAAFGVAFAVHMFPVERIDFPHDDVVAKLIMNPFLLRFGDCAVRRAEQDGAQTGGFLNGVLRAENLAGDSGFGHLRKLRMRPGMIADFAALGDFAFENFRIACGVFSDDEKGDVDMAFGENVEQSRRVGRARAVVKCHGDIFAFDVDAAETDLAGMNAPVIVFRSGGRRGIADGRWLSGGVWSGDGRRGGCVYSCGRRGRCWRSGLILRAGGVERDEG